MIVGVIETGGTKIKCAVAKSKSEIIDTIIIPTTSPIDTLIQAVNFFRKHSITSLGIASFGPINLNKNNPHYGMITNTPKIKWQYFNIYKYFKEALNVPIYINTDVNLAALGEYTVSKKNINSLIYMTIGTGIGVGVISNGYIIQGSHHSEMGHCLIQKRNDDNFVSICPNHHTCLEGLASGLSLKKRYNLSHEEMKTMDQIWDLEGYYVAQALYNYILAFAPEQIIIGGGVSDQELLFTHVRKYFEKINNKYFKYPALLDLKKFIKAPVLADNSAIYGAIIYTLSEAGDVSVC